MLKIKSENVLYHVFKVLHEGLQIIPGGILNKSKSNKKATQKDLRSLGVSGYKLDTGTSGTTLGRGAKAKLQIEAFSSMCCVGVCIYLCVFVQECMMQWRMKSV